MTAQPSDPAQERAIRVVALYPEVMDVYADRGNLIALSARCGRHGVGCELTAVGLGDPLPEEADLVLIGGGQDSEQRRIAWELAARGPRLREWVERDTAMLAVCGGFQLFGHLYRTGDGEELPGVGIFDAVTVAPGPGWVRCIGDVLAEAAVEGVGQVVGFENHGGRTYLGPGARPFARVLRGHGNNGDDGSEGGAVPAGDRDLPARLAAAEEPGAYGPPHPRRASSPLRSGGGAVSGPGPLRRACPRRCCRGRAAQGAVGGALTPRLYPPMLAVAGRSEVPVHRAAAASPFSGRRPVSVVDAGAGARAAGHAAMAAMSRCG